MEGHGNEKPPEDKFNIVYGILLLLGVGILMPWNMFITARSYFIDYKMSKNYTAEDSDYATYFLSSVGFASQVPNIIFNWINVFINIRGSVTPRVVLTSIVEILSFIVTVILAVTNTSGCLKAFFWSTMVTIIVINMANGVYENTIFGIASNLPLKYPGALIIGYNISGTLVSVIDIVTSAVAPSIKTAATYYFVTALLVLFTCLASYFILIRIKFYEYYAHLRLKPNGRTNLEPVTKIPYWNIFKGAFSQLFNVFFIFFVTLSVFPALQANIKKSDSHFIVPEKYYINIMCFLTFNTSALLGCILSNWIDWPSPKTLLIPVLLRGLFIPFFFFCNYQPTNKVRKAPVLFRNDWVYWVAGILIGFTSGYLSSKALIYTTASVETTYGSVTGKFGAAVLVTGIFVGVTFSMIFPSLAEL